MDPEQVELKSKTDTKLNESERKDNMDGPSQQMNEDMHTTFLNNNEQIIADLANLEAEQERQIFQIIYDTFKGRSGFAEYNDL